MIIRYLGHAEFLVESASGYRVLFDPYDAAVGYPMQEVRADAVSISHAHGDHSHVQKASGTPRVCDKAGETLLAPDVSLRQMKAYHDDKQGALRGQVLLSVLKMDGLCITHMGDLGHDLSEGMLAQLGQVDILLLPVGGFFTIDAEVAAQVAHAVAPKVVIPMHYKTVHNADWPIADASAFLQKMGAAEGTPMPLLRVTAADIVCLPPVVTMEICQHIG